MIVDVSGLDMFKQLQSEMKPVDFKLNGLPQYAANDKANVATDAEYVSVRKENPSEKFLSQDFFGY